MHTFDAATAVRALGNGRYAATLDPVWGVGEGLLNGGYLMALGVRSALVDSGHPDPLAVSATFLRPLPAGSATVVVEPLRSGRTVSSSRVTVGADEESPSVDMQVTAATLTGGATWTDSVPPVIARPEDCLRGPMPGAGATPPGLTEVLDYAFDPDTSGWLTGTPGRQPLLNLWLRFTDARPIDPLGLVLLCDACPPVLFALGRFGWAPTVAMQVLIRAVPAPGWCQVEARARLIGGGFSDEEVAVWDSTGALVAQSRQIAVPPRVAVPPRAAVPPAPR
ncbi:MAG: thioesterase family protein [Geodermatophilaceae bacterium]|nr:thioesterase family protein [Geodermatophilaceae bacterium]